MPRYCRYIPVYDSVGIYSEPARGLTRVMSHTRFACDLFSCHAETFAEAMELVIETVKLSPLKAYRWVLPQLEEGEPGAG